MHAGIVGDHGNVIGLSLPYAEKILPLCERCIVVTDSQPTTVAHTRILIDEITALGVNPAAVSPVLNNRIRFDTQLPWHEVQDTCVVLVQLIVAPEPLLTPPLNRPWQ